MTKWRKSCVVSGVLVLAGAALSYWHSPYWIALTAFAGLDLLQSGFTDRGVISSMFGPACSGSPPQEHT
jgi:hypothetical protein